MDAQARVYPHSKIHWRVSNAAELTIRSGYPSFLHAQSLHTRIFPQASLVESYQGPACRLLDSVTNLHPRNSDTHLAFDFTARWQHHPILYTRLLLDTRLLQCITICPIGSLGFFSPAVPSSPVRLGRRISGRFDPWRSVVLNVFPMLPCLTPKARNSGFRHLDPACRIDPTNL